MMIRDADGFKVRSGHYPYSYVKRPCKGLGLRRARRGAVSPRRVTSGNLISTWKHLQQADKG